jgi:hypothetical protein
MCQLIAKSVISFCCETILKEIMTKDSKKRQKGKHSRQKQTGGGKEFLGKLGRFAISCAFLAVVFLIDVRFFGIYKKSCRMWKAKNVGLGLVCTR